MMNLIAMLAAVSIAGNYIVSGDGLSGTVALPGTLADAKLGKRFTQAEYDRIDPKSIHKNCLTREYQHLGKAAYARKVTLSADDCRVPLEVFLERVMWKSEVFFDGVSLGACDLLSVPHVHPIPSGFATPGEHELRIEVDNSNQYRFSESSHSYGPQMQSVWHGVLGRMEIRERNALRDVRIFAEPGRRAFTVEVPPDFEADGRTVKVEGEEVNRILRIDAKHIEVELARVPESWNEFHPRLYRLVLTDPHTGFVVRHRFGFRTVAARDHALYVNGVRTFIRGNVENCNFAKNGSPALEKSEWLAIMRRLKEEDGINALRFHTWTPPEAAFEAADEIGLYLLPEADIWVDLRGTWEFTKLLDDKTQPYPLGFGCPIDGYAQRAMKAISDAYGNSPSFLSLAIGNELGGAKWEALEKWVAAQKAYDPRRLYFASTAREITKADDYMVTHCYPGIGMVREEFRPSTDWDYESKYARTAIPTMAHEIGQWPVYPMWDFLAKFDGHLRPYNIDRWRRLAAERDAIRFNRRYHDASAKQSRLIYKDEVESFLRTPSCAGVQLLNAQDFTGQGEALVGWRDPFYDLKPGFTVLPRFDTIWNVTNFLARISKWTWRRGETFRASLEVRNLGETRIPSGTAFACTLDGKPFAVALERDLEPGRLGPSGMVSLKLDDTVSCGSHDLRFGTNRWRFWVYPDDSAPSVPDGVTVTDDPKVAAARLAAGGTVVYTGRSVDGEKGTFKSCYWVGNKTWDWIPPLSAALGTCVDVSHPALREFPTEDWSDWQWYHLVQGANLHRLDGRVPASFRPITMSVSDFHFSFLASSLFEARVGPGRLLVCGYRIDGDDPAQIALKKSLFAYLSSGIAAPTERFTSDWFRKLFAGDRAEATPVVRNDAGVTDPCELIFRRIASRRYVLDNELPLATYEPTTVVADVQHPSPAFDANLVLVAGWCPCGHYSADIAAGEARLVFALPDGSARLGFRAVPGEKAAAEGVTLRTGEAVVPPAPFRFSVLTAGNRFSLLAAKDGRTVWLGDGTWKGTPDLRGRTSFGAVKFFVDAKAGAVTRAASSLSSGYGQADTRFVTTGRDKRLYLENGRVFFTFSARGVGAMGVASFDPSRFDVRLEGSVLFDAGDGLLRGDGPADLFYDDVADEWRAWVCNFSTVNSKDGSLSGREKGGVNYAWSRRSPLHGLSVMRERNMDLPGMNEDPTGFYDPFADKWRIFLSEFTAKGIRGSLWESENWNGPYARLTESTKEDSTGQCLVDVGGTRWAIAGSADRACHVYTYPDLKLHGDIRFDMPPWNAHCPNGRVWASLGVLPDGYPLRYVFLTMDRANFPGIPDPNWTYGAIYLYGADQNRSDAHR